MADYKKLIPIILEHEGGFVNDPIDLGGATMKGVTLNTFRHFYGEKKTVEDLKNITDEQWGTIFKKGYWDKVKADNIQSQSIANFLVDFAYNSGPIKAAKRLQDILGLKVDGIIGNISLTAINSHSPLPLFGKMKQDRIKFINEICEKRPANEKYRKGWMKRINSFQFEE